MAYTLPPLPYAYNALEPHIDARTMEIHHTKHHQAYINNVNTAIAGTELESLPVEKLIADLSKVPDDKSRRGAEQWRRPREPLALLDSDGPRRRRCSGRRTVQAISSASAASRTSRTEFAKAASTRFGSGWAWLVVEGGKLAVGSTANQDSPLMGKATAGIGGTPILGLDVWEHAYYLNYQNRRPDYITAWWNVVNWNEVAKRFAAAK